MFIGTRPEVWLVGHSYVYWAEKRAAVRPGGTQLGFMQANVQWMGVRGLRWIELLSVVQTVARRAKGPTVLVVHAAGNDLCSVRIAELIAIIKADFDRFPSYFRELLMIWSEIVPRAKWIGARKHSAIENARRVVNMRVSKHVRRRGGVVYRHHLLEGDNRSLLRSDGIHLNEIGMDIFLSGIQDAIERALFLLGGGRVEV